MQNWLLNCLASFVPRLPGPFPPILRENRRPWTRWSWSCRIRSSFVESTERTGLESDHLTTPCTSVSKTVTDSVTSPVWSAILRSAKYPPVRSYGPQNTRWPDRRSADHSWPDDARTSYDVSY